MREQKGRRVFVGDIQGCVDEFNELLEQLDFRPDDDQLICLGDLVNRGPASLETLRRIRELGGESVLGNHDLHLLAVAAGERSQNPGDTLDAILDAPDREDLLQWLRTRPLALEWNDVVAVHAGISPAWDQLELITQPLEAQIRSGTLPFESPDLAFLTRVRKCDAEGNMDENGDPWDQFYGGARIVACGHWAERGIKLREKLRAIDSGCVWGGSLSAWIAEEDRVISVPARQVYCSLG